MMSSGNRNVLRPLLTGLGAALCIGSFFAWDAMNSAGFAQDSNRCDGQRVRRDWVERHDEIRRARSALRDMIGAIHDRYTDGDFGYDAKSGKVTRRKFSDAFDAANRRFEELIAGAAFNSTRACHVCLLVGYYDKARRVDEGDKVTVEELERFPDWFDAMAADQDQIDRKRDELRDAGDRGGDRGRLEDTIGTLRRDIEDYKRKLADFRRGSDRDANSPLMASIKDNYVCEGM
jgi:hypothetical protein